MSCSWSNDPTKSAIHATASRQASERGKQPINVFRWGDRLGGGFLARDLALVAAALSAPAGLMALRVYVFRLFVYFRLF